MRRGLDEEVIMKTPVLRVVACTACLLTQVAIPLCHSVASAQVEGAKSGADGVALSYFVDAICFAAANSPESRLDVFVQVGYDNLSFVKRDDQYYASYEMTLSIYDSTSTLVNEKLWTEEVKGITFDESVSPYSYSLTERVFMVKPGRYLIAAVFRDNESKVPKRIVRQILVSNFANSPFALSDIMLVSRFSIKEGKKSIVPTVSSNVGNLPDAFFVFFEAYNDQHVDSMKLVATVLNEKGDRQLELDTMEILRPGRNELLMKINHTSLPLGDYSLFIRAYPVHVPVDQPNAYLAVTNRHFMIRWRGVPKGVKDIDLAIDQLRYIAKDGELSHMKEAKTLEEKQKRFLEFWKSKDPNRNTPRNEKMEEYYARVEYANKHFTHYIDGWRTDMGMVYIMFGSPNNVDRHPFEIDSKPYEVWSYYDLNYQFVFVDQSGFGDYKLTTPIWEVWQRPRN